MPRQVLQEGRDEVSPVRRRADLQRRRRPRELALESAAGESNRLETEELGLGQLQESSVDRPVTGEEGINPKSPDGRKLLSIPLAREIERADLQALGERQAYWPAAGPLDPPRQVEHQGERVVGFPAPG